MRTSVAPVGCRARVTVELQAPYRRQVLAGGGLASVTSENRWRTAGERGMDRGMQRPIVGYHLDPEGDWVAELSCGHGQHVRHRPPFSIREWAVTPEGRAGRLGQFLDCPWCDRGQVPSGHVAYRKTPVFTAGTIPAGLRSKHSTKAGVWGQLQVSSGSIAYILEGPPEERRVLAAGESVVIVPELQHRVEALGPVEFYVEFLRAPLAE